VADPIRHRIAVLTKDLLGERMAGPAIRAFQMARALAPDHDVILVSTVSCSLSVPEFRCVKAQGRELRALLSEVAVVVVQGYVAYDEPWLLSSDKIIVVDLYDPIQLEQLEQLKHAPPAEQRLGIDLSVRVLNEQIARGDFFLCASQEQRHFWLGQLAAFGRINPSNYARDATLESLIAICPFGLSEVPPVHTRAAIRTVVPGIGAEDKLVLWAGGVYNWFDPLTLIRAVHRLRGTRPDVKLYFLGMKHPNPDIPEMAIAWRTRELAEELGLLGTTVFFNEGWVDYEDRQNYLLEADAGVSTHHVHLETAFSFRTRILDYLWANLPIVSTGGDSFGELVDRAGLGVKVAEGDVEGLAAALDAVLYDEDVAQRCRAAVARVRGDYTWPVALSALTRFCADPRRAADAGRSQQRILRLAALPRNRSLRRVLRAWSLLREGGLELLARGARGYLERTVRARRRS